ncbi:hypothetical protein A6U96_16030 [Agrobacterium tumefaciens]|nr:hypothetical protein A6U96_16030 [Agrobacterium tumefaciens]
MTLLGFLIHKHLHHHLNTTVFPWASRNGRLSDNGKETLSLPGKISLLTRVLQNFAMLVGLKVKKVALKSAGRLCPRRNAVRNAPLVNGQIPPILLCMMAQGSEHLSELLMNAGVRGNARLGKISS